MTDTPSLTYRQQVLKCYPKATVYVTGEPKVFAICSPGGRRRVMSSIWLSNWHRTKADAWENAALQIAISNRKSAAIDAARREHG